MDKKIIGKVTSDEKNEIQKLFERRNGLYELAKIITIDNNNLYEKLVNDLGETESSFQNWWNTMSDKYKWESVEDGNWEIDFETCNIYLITNK
ncbi:CXXX repeat peptide modification system protein [uncultured Bacteroides sp.]|uniref:CXXX repeat peptide modification system protein n=1 Tax=uncultured Bacteroides sp. TaxID=162156 RepID=UPI0027D9B9EC|nr:CXXX repeat peptide modification system protein [uncultured Bacteroides sp.]